MSEPTPPPYAELTTLFLDVGNTLISMDYAWIREELAQRGVRVDVNDVVRAEAAARPPLSEQIAKTGGHREDEAQALFALYLAGILEQLEHRVGTLAVPCQELVRELVPVLRAPGGTARLWTNVLPGIPAALERLSALDLQLVVVSNADGTVESILEERGLHAFFDAVLDSSVVGFEKPDPRIFRHALAASRADPARTLHVGDFYHADVVGARSADVWALLLDPFDDWQGVDCPRLRDLVALADAIEAARRGD